MIRLQKKCLFFLLTLAVLLVAASCAPQTVGNDSSAVAVSSVSSAESSPSGGPLLSVYYMDVGQGDSVFLELPNGKTMLIDASEAQYGQQIVNTICGLGHDSIDYVVATHPHSDHIGGMKTVLQSLQIGCVYMPDVSASTATYIGMANAILEREIPAEIAQAGTVVLKEEDLLLKFLAPITINDADQNQNSAVLYLQYGQTKFLFMGDADISIEESILPLEQCDVLKVGHHGSRTASGEAFLAQAKPRYAIISCGTGNSYGHPHDEALNRLKACGSEILRTDLLGTILVRSDGKDVTLVTEEPILSESLATDDSTQASQHWVLNTSSKKIHYASCSAVESISEKNRMESDKTLDALLAEGYTACGICHPHA